MSDSKVLLFGSFTEDETNSWMPPKSNVNTGKLVNNVNVQFGSLNFTEGKSLGSSADSELKGPSGSLTGSITFGSTDLAKDDTELETVQRRKSHSPRESGVPKENGSNYNFNQSFPCTNGVTTMKVDDNGASSLCVSNGHNNSLNQFSRLITEDSKENGSIDHLQENVLKENFRRASNVSVTSSTKLLPRGLINPGNLCFLNSTLQALLSCPPFVDLLRNLRNREIPKAGYSTLTAFVEFISAFEVPSSTVLNKDVAAFGKPFSPLMFDGVLKNFSPDLPSSILGRPRQEDAQEFLSFVMDQMHAELLKLDGMSSSTNGGKSFVVASAEDDEWETVGRKNKTAVMRTQSFVPSELSEIFGGQLESTVKAKGNKASATVQPFLSLHLDIYPEAVRTIEDALRLFSAPETLEGYRPSAAGKAGVVAASKSVKIQKQSKIMILHLKRFGYGSHGSTKLNKPVHFSLELVLNRDLLVSSSIEGRKYELVATITHHGRESSKGHYTADVRYHDNQWLRFDDASVTAIGKNNVLHDRAYVLFYKRV
ncbi:ubiquitin carboxyl-terminal hydrolase 24 [Benincasa hispida]|uniref:ubiquitin carboxyl-terminal hydrolase 24 n=1 Tax=Benincasa hispida TaxID=102211 RepID=UPI0018FFBD75|nr:ubiquitin carboxyl-terminal hydrolase 24 [Benincasa hispida]